jgi:hypothetical protein
MPALGADILFWTAAASCAVGQFAIIRAVVRAPDGEPGAGDSPLPPASPDSAVPRPRRSSEIAWTLLPALALVLVLAATWRAVRRDDTQPTNRTASAVVQP